MFFLLYRVTREGNRHKVQFRTFYVGFSIWLES